MNIYNYICTRIGIYKYMIHTKRNSVLYGKNFYTK